MLLRFGVESKEVRELRGLMRRAGYLVGESQKFDEVLARCVRAYQEDRRLYVDGMVLHGRGQSWPRLAKEQPESTCSDPSPRAERLSRGLATLFDSQQMRMIPEYRSSHIGAWERMEAGEEHAFVVPFACDGSGRHGATCGHAAWLLTSWWMRAMYPEKGMGADLLSRRLGRVISRG